MFKTEDVAADDTDTWLSGHTVDIFEVGDPADDKYRLTVMERHRKSTIGEVFAVQRGDEVVMMELDVSRTIVAIAVNIGFLVVRGPRGDVVVDISLKVRKCCICRTPLALHLVYLDWSGEGD